MRPMWRPAFLLGSFLRELESQVAFFSTRVGTPEADSCAFFSLTVHDLATLLTGHADHAPYVEARVLPAGVLFFCERAGESGDFNPFCYWLAQTAGWHVGG